jgi:cyclopropane fatty-acyl-phospholipid synthase-like methyltransferase/methyltransferase-like protein
MSDQHETSYDRVPYPSRAYSQTHPDRLATIAALHGMRPVPVSRCRVLEIGCGSGGNLIPMAYQLPGTEFLGIDLCGRATREGTRNIAALGLRNIRLLHHDILDIDPAFGTFDYIIAHGVYSWVPDATREQLLDVCSRNLAPQGVAYLSYNCYPGSRLRDITRDMMLFHAAELDPQQRVQQSRALLKLISEASAEDEIYGRILRDQYEHIKHMPDEVLFHDDLDPGSRAFMLYQVVRAARRHGLQYLCEATLSHSHLGCFSDKIMSVLDRLPVSEAVSREQYLDFVTGRGFRETLLCHQDVELQRDFTADCVRHYHLSARAMPASGEIDPHGSGAVTFKTAYERTLSTDHRLSKVALLYLGKHWPEAVAFSDLLDRTRQWPEGETKSDSDADVMHLSDVLFRGYRAGQIDLHLYPPALTATVSERPEASRLARTQAQTAKLVTNLRHGAVILEDTITRRFLPLVDGTRTIDELTDDLRAELEAARHRGEGMDTNNISGDSAGPQVTPENVERNLKILASLALLIR